MEKRLKQKQMFIDQEIEKMPFDFKKFVIILLLLLFFI